MRRALLTVGLAAAWCAPLAAPAADARTTVERSGDRLVVVADATNGRTVLAEGNGRIVVDAHDAVAGAGCARDAFGSAVGCPAAGIQQVVVALAGGPDDLTAYGLRPPLAISTGAGRDKVWVGRARQPAAIDGGPDWDRVTFDEHHRGLRVRMDGQPGADVALRDVEHVRATDHPDVITGGPARDYVEGNGGADRIDLRGGGADIASCDGDPASFAVLDPWDDDLGCPATERAGEAWPAGRRPGVRRHYATETAEGGMFAAAGFLHRRPGLAAVPEQAGARLALRVHGPPGTVAVATIALRPWRGSRASPPATAAGRVARSGRATLRLRLGRAARATLARAGRARARLTIRYRYGRSTATISDDLPAIGRRRSRVRRDGRVRRGGYGTQRVRGTGRGDHLTGRSGDDRLRGRGGNDRLHGGTGDDVLRGERGHDRLDGGDGDDDVRGGPGDDDVIESRFGDDRLDGGPGDDVIHGVRGGDRMFGGPGDDVLRGGMGPDRMDCGPGEDIAYINFASELRLVKRCEHILLEPSVRLVRCMWTGTPLGETLLGTPRDDRCVGGAGDDYLEGDDGDDVLIGGTGDDLLFGRFGRDRMDGGPGNDEIEGSRGRDLLLGGAGRDRLNGGYGRDVVRAGAGNDRVMAHSNGRDRIDCGPGRDRVVADRADRVRRCERVVRTG